MRYLFYSFLTAVAMISCTQNMEPTEYVDPFIGTGFHGHTYPGATTPYGMVQLSPDTRVGGWDACSGYHYSDDTILGFSHTHLSGTGCADLSDILFYPSVKPLVRDGNLYSRPAHKFSHSNEYAEPGYYSVELDGEAIKAELTAAPHTGVHRYTFREGDVRVLLIDMEHFVGEEIIRESELKVLSDTEVCGYRKTDAFVLGQRVYFNARFSQPFKAEVLEGSQVLLTFPSDIDQLTAAVSISAVSYDNAIQNGLAEVPVLDFDKEKSEACEMWKGEMDDITVKGGKHEDMVNFYTALYHTKVCPNIMSDVNGQFRRHDDTIGTVPEGKSYYSTLSLWDTFRAWNPLQTIVNTQLVDDMIYSMLEMYRASGELPLWPLSSGETYCMIGYHSTSVIVDAYMKGIRSFDPSYALDAMVKSSNINKKASDVYIDYGFVPSDRLKESVSLTLEYAYNDWNIARLAESLGKKDIAEEYYRRAHNYENLFDGNTLFFRGRNHDYSWVTPFETTHTGRDFTEATPWHYRFFVPHDIEGLVNYFGTKETFISALDDLFTLQADTDQINVSDVTGLMGQYAHGNEPSHHMAYLYSYVGQPWKTQKYTRALLDEMYKPTPEGIVGNEDAGQMSAWYVMSALGFYSVCPGTDQFVFTTPLFEEASLNLANGKVLTIKANNPARNRYIKDITLNGKRIDANYITYGQLMEGGELVFTLTSEPYTDRGVDAAVPYSMTVSPKVAAPYTSSNTILFKDNVDIDLNTVTEGARIHYTVDGTEPTEKSPEYTAPINVTKTSLVKAKAFKAGMEPSIVTVVNAVEAIPFPAKSVRPSVKGVNYRYYEGPFTKTNMIEKAKVLKSGIMTEPSISSAESEDHFGYVFDGYVYVDQTGIWEFSTTTDDGSVLFIDGQCVVNNDGGHAAVTAVGRVPLEKGYHAFKILYFEDYEGQDFAWGWKAPGQNEFMSVPSEVLFCR